MLGLGASIFTVFEHLFGSAAGFVAGTTFPTLSLCLLYGLALALRSGEGRMPDEAGETALRTKIDQLLTEARVIIPGGQALLGFQFVATFTKSFSRLPDATKYVHAAALCAVALAVTVLMTPAPLHRIAFHGEDDERFYRIGSALVIGAVWPLALGISADMYVVFFELSRKENVATVAAFLSLGVLLALWFAYPVWQRSVQRHRARSRRGS